MALAMGRGVTQNPSNKLDFIFLMIGQVVNTLEYLDFVIKLLIMMI